MNIAIREVSSRGELKDFIVFPYRLYRENKFWIPPLISEEYKSLSKNKNPSFEHCEVKMWLAYKNGEIAGRIAGIINNLYINKWEKKYVRFGWLDFIDDTDISKTLFDTFESWAVKKGMESAHGPLGFTDLDREGMLIEGFEETGTAATIYNYPYYQKHMESLGYVKDVDWVEYEFKPPEMVPEKAAKLAEKVIAKEKIRILDSKDSKIISSFMPEVFKVLNNSFNDIYGFTPLTQKEIRYYLDRYFDLASRDFSKILLDSENKVAAFIIALPSLSEALQKARGKLLPFGIFHIMKALRNPKKIDFYLGGVRPDFQGKGLTAVLMAELSRIAIKKGIISFETNIELENNFRTRNHWKYFNPRLHKRRRCYIKELTVQK